MFKRSLVWISLFLNFYAQAQDATADSSSSTTTSSGETTPTVKIYIEGPLKNLGQTQAPYEQNLGLLTPPVVAGLSLYTKNSTALISFGLFLGTPISSKSFFFGPEMEINISTATMGFLKNISLGGSLLIHNRDQTAFKNSPLGGDSWNAKLSADFALLSFLQVSPILRYVSPGQAILSAVEEDSEVLYSDTDSLDSMGLQIRSQLGPIGLFAEFHLWNTGVTAIISKNFGTTLPADNITESVIGADFSLSSAMILNLQYHLIQGVDDPVAFANRSLSAHDPYLSSTSHLKGGVTWIF